MPPATSRKGVVPLRRGLGHPRAQSRPPAASTQPAPPRTICRILAGPRPQGLRGPHPPGGRRHLTGWGHSPEPRRRPARAWLGPRQTLARASPAAAARGGAGAHRQPIGGASLRSRPIRAAPLWVDPTETFQGDPSASPGSSRTPRAAAQWTIPPRLSRGGLYYCGAAEGEPRLGPGQSRWKGDERPMKSWDPRTTCCWPSVGLGCPRC